MADNEPGWMSNPAAAQDAPVSSGVNSSSGSSHEPPFKSAVTWMFFVLNIGFMVFLAATGAIGIGSSNDINDSGLFFVGMYLMLFSSIVVLYELSQVLQIESFDLFMKKNFGFLYGTIGKGFFILFCGVLTFGLKEPKSLAIACGVLVSAWGPLQIAIYMKFPEYFDVKEKYQP